MFCFCSTFFRCNFLSLSLIFCLCSTVPCFYFIFSSSLCFLFETQKWLPFFSLVPMAGLLPFVLFHFRYSLFELATATKSTQFRNIHCYLDLEKKKKSFRCFPPGYFILFVQRTLCLANYISSNGLRKLNFHHGQLLSQCW